MALGNNRRTGFLLGVASMAALLAILTQWAFSKRHAPLEYMVGGTLATSILLAAAFVQIVKRGYLSRSRRADTVPYRTRQQTAALGQADLSGKSGADTQSARRERSRAR